MKKLFTLIFAIMLVVSLASCEEEGKESSAIIYSFNDSSLSRVIENENPSWYRDTHTLVEPVRTGYEFLGWYLDEELTEEVTELNQEEHGVVMVFAKWQVIPYTVTYEKNGGMGMSSASAVYNTPVYEPADPVKDGYEFGGWYEDEELTELFDFDQTMPAENFTIYAKWVEK